MHRFAGPALTAHLAGCDLVGGRAASSRRQPTPSGGNMTRFRMGALTALIACVGAFGLAGTASAQVTPAKVPASQKVAITGTKGFKGTYTITKFQKSGNKIVTLGTLKGT